MIMTNVARIAVDLAMAEQPGLFGDFLNDVSQADYSLNLSYDNG